MKQNTELVRPGVAETKHWHKLPDDRLQCDICPRHCRMREGQRGLCYVRGVEEGKVRLFSYGRSSGFCVDPIEKKPLNHFLPGTPVLSFGTAGCNLACKFCQNWDTSKSRKMDTLSGQAMPEDLAEVCSRLKCRSIAFTYNDPVIFHEYAIDTAEACRERNVRSVAVTAGWVCAEPRKEFFAVMDAANIDLKAFTESFYKKICGGSLADVLDTLLYLHNETDVWVELTNLIIPGENDSTKELEEMTRWVVDNLGVNMPMHFSAFHPDWKMLDKPRTPPETLIRARKIAIDAGVRYSYVGNIHNIEGDTTWCHECGHVLIERDWYLLRAWNLDGQHCCNKCGTPVAGWFEATPGKFGRRRIPIKISGSMTKQ